MKLASMYGLVGLIAAMTFIFRYLPFAFNKFIDQNQTIQSIRKFLPASIMLLLILYTLKDVSLKTAPHGLYELSAILIVMFVHHQWRNALLSIGAGTAFYVLSSNYF